MTFDEAASEAVNAANKVLFEAGFTDKTVAQLGFVPSDATKRDENKAVTVVGEQVFETWLCDCYDCVGVPVGKPCICNGPNCKAF